MHTKTRSHRSIVNKVLSVIVLALFLILVFMIFHATEARGQSGAQENVSYISVQIEEGDSLWAIASRYKAPSQSLNHYIDQIRKVNGLHTDTIIASQYLVIPLYT